MSYEDARETVFGIPYSEWKYKYQIEATTEQKAIYAERKAASGEQ